MGAPAEHHLGHGATAKHLYQEIESGRESEAQQLSLQKKRVNPETSTCRHQNRKPFLGESNPKPLLLSLHPEEAADMPSHPQCANSNRALWKGLEEESMTGRDHL